MTMTHKRPDVDQFVEDVAMAPLDDQHTQFTVEFCVNAKLGVTFLLDASGHSIHLGPCPVRTEDAVDVVQALVNRALKEQTW